MNDPHRLPETWATACGENKQNFQGLTEFKHVPPRHLLGAYKATHAEQGTF